VKIKLDENLPDDLAVLLRAAEYDVSAVTEEGLAGYDDPPVLEAATAEDRVLVSFDLGFADIRRYPQGTHAGIVWKVCGQRLHTERRLRSRANSPAEFRLTGSSFRS
jgi:predicted nuclease of predicted toxin-antitoxin system